MANLIMSKGAAQSATADDRIIAKALRVLEQRAKYQANTVVFTDPKNVQAYLRLRMHGLEHEVFAVLFLDSQHKLIAYEEMFRGTLAQTSVYPREVVKAALRHNAGAVLLAHNHPSGSPEPSRADEFLTSTLKSALALVDVRVLDHVVVTDGGCTSFAERGLI